MKFSIVFASLFCLLLSAYGSPKLRIAQDGPRRIFIHRAAEYTITVSNIGDGVAKDLVLLDCLPPELEYLSAEPSPNAFIPAHDHELATIVWNLDDIHPNQDSVVIKLRLRPNIITACRNIRNIVQVRSNSLELAQSLESYYDITILGTPIYTPNFYDTEDPVEVGKQTIYIIVLRNEGSKPYTKIHLKIKVDDKMKFVSGQGPSSYEVEENWVIFGEVPSLLPAETLTYKIVCCAIKEGFAKHLAIFRYAEFDKDIISEESTTVYK